MGLILTKRWLKCMQILLIFCQWCNVPFLYFAYFPETTTCVINTGHAMQENNTRLFSSSHEGNGECLKFCSEKVECGSNEQTEF